MARNRSPARLNPRASLELFAERVEDLGRTALIRKHGLSGSWSISYSANQPLMCRSIEPDRDLFAAYLLQFRKFVSKGEPIYIDYIFGICHDQLTNDQFRAGIRHCQEGWRQTLEENGVRLTVDGKRLQPHEIGDLWINGYYFHDDPEKQAELQRIVERTFLFVRHEFISYVVTATNVVGHAGRIIRAALKESALKF